MKVFVALVALLGSSAALGADLSTRKAPNAPTAAAISWAGLNVGGGLSLMSSKAKMDYSHVPTLCNGGNYTDAFGNSYTACANAYSTYSDAFQMKNARVRPHVSVGYNWMAGDMVVGVVAEAKLGTANGLLKTPLTNWSGDSLHVRYGIGTEVNARVLVGKSFDSFLPYLTGGLAFAPVKSGYLQQAVYYAPNYYTPVDLTTKSNKFGYSVGGGVKYAIDQHWDLGLEYIYSSFGRVNTTSAAKQVNGFGSFWLYPDTVASTRVSTQSWQMKVGYRF